MSPILAPEKSLMLQHLTLLFGRALNGRIEITGIHTDDLARPRAKTRFFRLDELEDACDYAAEINAEPGRNVYFGAALRNEDVFPGKAADDDDFLCAYAIWADADDAEQLKNAREAYRLKRVIPPFIVVTGRTPSTRAQMWWPLETPIDDIDELRAVLRGVAAVLKTDPKVCTGKQLMRLAGSVNWPKKHDRVLERTEVVMLEDAQRGFELAQLKNAFPPLARGEASGEGIADVEVAHGGALGLEEKITDGREGYAFRLVRAHLREFIGTTGAEPSPDELYRSVAPVYLKRVDLVRPGRGPEFLKQKCAEALRAYHAGQIPGMRSLEEAVLSWAGQAQDASHNPVAPDDEFEEAEREEEDDLYEVLSIADLRALPDIEWLVEDAIPMESLGFIYGPPGSFKSFVCYDLALSLACGLSTWLERPMRSAGGVLYIAHEGASGAKKRIDAWKMARGVEDDPHGFHLIRKSLSFMQADHVDRLERTVAAHVAKHGPVGLVFVDTVSRVLPGADENLQKDMTVFVAACDRLRERFGAAVIGVHHTNKAGDMRGSTVFLGQGDFVFRVEKDEGGKGGVLTCEKQKDAEDGWKEAFEVTTKEWTPEGRIKSVSSLVLSWSGAPAPKDRMSDWPPRETLREFQRVLASSFEEGAPLSMAPQTKNVGRYAPNRLGALFNVKSTVVRDVVETWLSNGVVEVREADKHSKARGLQVVKWLD